MIFSMIFSIISVVSFFVSGFLFGMAFNDRHTPDVMILDSGCFERGCACVDSRVNSEWVAVEVKERL